LDCLLFVYPANPNLAARPSLALCLCRSIKTQHGGAHDAKLIDLGAFQFRFQDSVNCLE
jgi:hypothetical protein